MRGGRDRRKVPQTDRSENEEEEEEEEEVEQPE